MPVKFALSDLDNIQGAKNLPDSMAGYPENRR
jgi:hypothetical protein